MEVMLTKLEQFSKPTEGIYDSSVDIPDELAPIWKLGSKISLVNDEMKVSMVLIKERVKNEFELIKNGSNTQKFMLQWKDPRVKEQDAEPSSRLQKVRNQRRIKCG